MAAVSNDEDVTHYVPSPWTLLADVGAALGASFCVAPFIAIVDKAIVENTSGLATMKNSLKSSFTELFLRPHKFFAKPTFFMLWGVYGGTYIAANFISSVCDTSKATDHQRHMAKFVGVSSINITLNVTKDRAFARMFGSGVARPIPMSSLAMFCARDSMTVFASFNLAPLAAEAMGSAATSQLVCPLLMQFVSAPLHIMGLDRYNRPAETMASRLNTIKEKYLQTALARCGRIGPAFGVGALLNAPLRKYLHSQTALAQQQ